MTYPVYGGSNPTCYVPVGKKLTKSLRLRRSASAYLNRTPTSGNYQLWTMSFWAKIGSISNDYIFLGGTNGTRNAILYRNGTTGTINFSGLQNGVGLNGGTITTNAVYMDPSSWYHIVAAYDESQPQSSKVKYYVNGVLQTTTGSYTYVTEALINSSGKPQYIGVNPYTGTLNNFADGYMAEVNFIDGQALTSTSFGQFDPVTGVWVPVNYTGTYGTNGFYLPFTNTTSTATLGNDFSGNGNNWTTNNISLTAGSTYDSMVDVPTLTSSTQANYCVLNPLAAIPKAGAIRNGGLQVFGIGGSVANATAIGTIIMYSGKYYAEFYFDLITFANLTCIGLVPSNVAYSGIMSSSTISLGYLANGNKRVLASTTAYGASWVAGNIIGVAVDVDSNTVTFYKNGVSQGTITSSAFFAQGPCVFSLSSDDAGSPTGFANFGQQPFNYTPPAGFLPLNTLNLPCNTTVTTSGTFTGNGSVTGPFVYLNGTPLAMTINGNAVTFGSQANKLANGFAVTTSSASYNAVGSNTYSVTSTGSIFRYEDAQPNP